MKKTPGFWKRFLMAFVILISVSAFLILIFSSSLLFLSSFPPFINQVSTINSKIYLLTAWMGLAVLEITLWYFGFCYIFPDLKKEKEK